MDPIVITAIFKPKEGTETQLLAELKKIQAASQTEPGCIKFELHQSIEDNTFVFYEIWRDAEAVKVHHEMDHYKEYRTNIANIDTSREIYKLKVI